MDPTMIMGLLGGLGGLFGGEQEQEYELPPEVRKILEEMMQRYRGTMRSVNPQRNPLGSRPVERQLLERGAGQQGLVDAGIKDALMGQLREGDANGYGDAMKGLGAMQSMNQANTRSQMMLEFLKNRDQTRKGAFGLLGQAGSLASSSYRLKPQTPNPFEGLAPALGQFAYWQTMRQGQSGGGGGNTSRDLQAGDSLGTGYTPPPWLRNTHGPMG